MKLFSRAAVVACTLAVMSHSPIAAAQRQRSRARTPVEQPPSPVALSVQARPGSLHWSFSLTNRGDRPVDVAVDRNMLSVEITAPAPVVDPSAPRRRAPRAPKPARCRTALFHSSTEQTARAQLAAGESYTEGFDLRSLCGTRFPRALVPGASLTFSYGARAKRPSFSRTVVFVDGEVPIEELRAETMTLSTDASAFPPAPPASEGSESGPVVIRAPSAISADRAAGLSFSVSARTRGPVPLSAFYRPSMWSLEVVTPRGRAIRCSDAPLGYVGLPDYLRSITRRSGPSTTLSVGLLCDRNALSEAGVYYVRVVFESNVEPVTSRQPSFRGVAVSRWMAAVIRRGSPAERYRPMPVDDPAPRPNASAAGANTSTQSVRER